jgi:hypothetical protein
MTKVVNLYKEEYTIYIGRPSKWGNPFEIGKDGSREEVLQKYKKYILKRPELLEMLPQLKNQTLGCFCKPKPCHGDILIELLEEGKWI